MESLLEIKKLDPFNSEIFSPIPLKILNNEKGKAVFLNSTNSINSVAFVEFYPGGIPRGNHFHITKRELLYIIEGKLEFYYWVPLEEKIKSTILESGNLIIIEPMLAHAYKAKERTIGFEMGSSEFNPEDTIYDPRIE